jgi:hypothetical protein
LLSLHFSIQPFVHVLPSIFLHAIFNRVDMKCVKVRSPRLFKFFVLFKEK